MKKVSIIDYGLSNILSVARAFSTIGMDVSVEETPSNLGASDCLVLPGVGAFGSGMTALEKNEWPSTIDEWIKAGKPFLGICLGMQLMLDSSLEIQYNDGLKIIEGEVLKLPEKRNNKIYRLPHVAWSKVAFNDTIEKKYSKLWSGIGNNQYFYFVHSYHVLPKKRENSLCISSFHDYYFTSGIIKENAVGLQFHPEKSGPNGLKLLENFTQLF